MGENKPVQYDGEYVLTSDGNKDFGEIKAETGIAAGKIRLRKGEHNEVTDTGYGEVHIERPHRLNQLKQNGYYTARDIVSDVAQSYNEIHKAGGNAIFLSAPLDAKKKKIIVVELIHSKNGEYYDVKTAWIVRGNYLKNKTPLWTKPESGVNTGEETAHYSQQNHSAPLGAIMGNPSTSLSPTNQDKSSDISELAALEQSAAVDDFKAKFSDLVNSYLGESGYNDLLWIAMNADTEEQAAEYARKMYCDDAATVEKHFFEFAKKHEKKIEDNIAKTGLADTEIADEFDRLVEDENEGGTSALRHERGGYIKLDGARLIVWPDTGERQAASRHYK